MLAQTVIKKPVCLRAPARQKMKRQQQQQKKNHPKDLVKVLNFLFQTIIMRVEPKLGRVSKAKQE